MRGLIIASVATLIVTTTILPLLQSPPPLLEEANNRYSQADTLPLARQHNLNHSLSAYLTLERNYHPTMGNGNLYNRIGDNYAALDAPAWALYYYEKARTLRPFDTALRTKSTVIRDQLQLPPPPDPSPFMQLFIIQMLPLPLQLQVLLISTIAATLLLYQDWRRPRKASAIAAHTCSAIALYLALGVGYIHYVAPIKAIVVEGSYLYRNANRDSSIVDKSLLFPGQQLHVTAVVDNGYWLQVTDHDDVGYIPASAARLL